MIRVVDSWTRLRRGRLLRTMLAAPPTAAPAPLSSNRLDCIRPNRIRGNGCAFVWLARRGDIDVGGRVGHGGLVAVGLGSLLDVGRGDLAIGLRRAVGVTRRARRFFRPLRAAAIAPAFDVG